MTGFEIPLAVGLVLLVLAGIALAGALIEGRPPRVAAVVLVVAGGLVIWAVRSAGRPLTWEDIPLSFVALAAGILN